MKCSEIMELLEELAPRRMACDWDNPGLLAGRREKEIKKILLTVDVDDQTVETAVKEQADMIVSHAHYCRGGSGLCGRSGGGPSRDRVRIADRRDGR